MAAAGLGAAGGGAAMDSAPRWPVGRAGAALVVGAALLAWLLLPTAPNYDTATHLVWAHELLAGRAPDVGALAAPTLHPLWLLIAVPAQATGAGASLLQLISIGSFAVVIACAWRLAADLCGRLGGVLAALATASSFALILLAFKAYVDLPFLALVLLALVAETGPERDPAAPDGTGPRSTDRTGAWTVVRFADRGGAGWRRGAFRVPVLFFVAGLLRPEAWAFGLLFMVVRLVRGTPWRALVRPVLLIVAAPVLWCLADLLLTGDPLHSLNGTQALAEELGRPTGLLTAPKELVLLLGDLARPPAAAAGALGVLLALRLVGWRRLLLPLTVLVAAGVGFLCVGALGLPLLQRYLLVPAVLLCVFAGVAGAVLISAALGRPVVEAPAAAPTEPQRSAAAIEAAGPVPAAEQAIVDQFSAMPVRTWVTADASAIPERVGRPSPLVRGLAVALLAVGVLGVGGYLVLKADSFRIVARGVLREARWQRQATELLRDPRLAAAESCGPITLPTYRFVPELTLRAELDAGRVVSRATQLGGAGPQRRGVAIVVAGDHADKIRLGWAAGVPRTTNQVPPGFTVAATRGPFVAATRCG